MTAAIYFHPEAYTTSGPKLMGRNAAGESFLRGFFAHSRATEFWAQVGGAAGHGAWSLCGITHTTSSAGAMDAIANLLTAPVQPWDAVICTSSAVKDNVTRLLQAQADYLLQRLGVQRLVCRSCR